MNPISTQIGAALLLLMAVTIVMVMIWANGWDSHKRRKEPATHDDNDSIQTREDWTFSTAPRWAGILNEKLNQVLAGQRRLHQQIGSEARADERRDIAMSAAHDAIIAELAAASTERAGFLVLLKALKDGQGNPAKLEEIAQSVKTGRQEWISAFEENVEPPAEPPVEPPVE